MCMSYERNSFTKCEGSKCLTSARKNRDFLKNSCYFRHFHFLCLKADARRFHQEFRISHNLMICKKNKLNVNTDYGVCPCCVCCQSTPLSVFWIIMLGLQGRMCHTPVNIRSTNKEINDRKWSNRFLKSCLCSQMNLIFFFSLHCSTINIVIVYLPRWASLLKSNSAVSECYHAIREFYLLVFSRGLVVLRNCVT